VTGTLLHVSVSTRGEASLSRRAGRQLVDRLIAERPGLRVVARDLARVPPPQPAAAFVQASLTPPDRRLRAQTAALAYSEALIGELEAADIVVIDTPMHNFTVPAALKAWIDYVVRPHRTFRFSPAGKIGLLHDRPVLVIVACGGRFDGKHGGQADFLPPYLRYVLGTIGLSRVEVLRLERLSRGDAQVANTFAEAREWIDAQVAACALEP
jgi:FMN-dependent NADH-azoreductase